MKQLKDTVWQRRRISWIWDNDAFASVTRPQDVVSMREFLRMVRNWPDELPSNGGDTLVVAGMDACLDLLTPEDAAEWLSDVLKRAILSFQDGYDGDAALVFWLPNGQNRFRTDLATDAVRWECGPPNRSQKLDLGRILWGEAREYPQDIFLADTGKSAGLFHLRIT